MTRSLAIGSLWAALALSVASWTSAAAAQERLVVFTSFGIGRVDRALGETAETVYAYKAGFLNGLAKAVETLGPPESPFAKKLGPVTSARILALHAAREVLADTHSEHVETAVLPYLQGAIQALEDKYAVRSLYALPRSPATVGVAIQALRHAFVAARPFISDIEELGLIDRINAALGRAMAHSVVSADLQACEEYLQLVSSLQAQKLTETLVSNFRTAGLGGVISKMTGYLKEAR